MDDSDISLNHSYENQLKLIQESLKQTSTNSNSHELNHIPKEPNQEEKQEEAIPCPRVPASMPAGPILQYNHRSRKVRINRSVSPTSSQDNEDEVKMIDHDDKTQKQNNCDKLRTSNFKPFVPNLTPPLVFPQIDTAEQANASMLMSWYMAGYHTGYNEAMKKHAK